VSVLPVGFGSSGGYQITNSVRLRAAASAYFSRTFGSAGSTTKGTLSMWLKRGKIGADQRFFYWYNSSPNEEFIYFTSGDALSVIFGGGSNGSLTTTALFRDPTAHLHLVVAIDTAQGTAIDRVKIYANGVLLTYSGTQNGNALTGFNSAQSASIGTFLRTLSEYYDGLMSEVVWIDGTQKAATDFGETDSNGVWVPKAYTGTYGTNGFHLDFKDAALTAGSNVGLGKDVSGNGNYWTTNNISVTAGVTYDSTVDTPTNNYATLNPLAVQSGTVGASNQPTYANANLKATASANNCGSHGSVGFVSGKWYWEVTVDAGSTVNLINILGISYSGSSSLYDNGVGYEGDGGKQVNGVNTAYGASFTTNDIIGVAVNADTNQIEFFKTNSSQGSISFTPTNTIVPSMWMSGGTGVAYSFNFGQRPFTYTPPTGFKALCTANLPAVAIAKPALHFDAKTRVGTAATYSVTGEAFQPDFVWVKSRGRALDHALYDSVRGVQKRLETNNTDAEVTGDSTGLTAFNSDGYTGGALDQINGTTATNAFVDWMWKAGGAGASNTDGSITSTVSANQTAGFSIATYTGNATSGASIGHGLGVVPKLIVVKNRDAAAAWPVYHGSLANTENLLLNTTDAKASSGYWNSFTPTTTIFKVDNSTGANGNTHKLVAYCFAEVAGYSKFDKYLGNGSADGPFVYCGFRPKYVMIKHAIGGTGDWRIYDSARDTYNVGTHRLWASAATAEDTSGLIDFTANGFKIRNDSTQSEVNVNGDTYVFAAFAEHPFGGSNVSPSPAR